MEKIKIMTPFGEKIKIYADYTGSGMMYNDIDKFMKNNISPFYSNTHSNSYTGQMMAHYIKESKKNIRKSINASHDDKIIFTGNGSTCAINHLIHVLNLEKKTTPKTIIFVSTAEHHSNYLPWTHLPVDLVVIPINKDDGIIDLISLENNLIKYRDRPIICSFNAGSNITGVLQPVYTIANLVHQYGGSIFYDYAGCAPYVKINMNNEDSYFDAIFISPHKFLGGPGCPGILIAKNYLFINEKPFYPGGGTVEFVCKRYIRYSDNEETKETGGTPNILGSIQVGLVFELKDKKIDYIIKKNKEINDIVYNYMNKINNLILLNHKKNMHIIPIYSFIIKDLHYNFIVVLLNDLFGIQTRGGISCCSLYAQFLLNIDNRNQDMICKKIDENGHPGDYGWCRVTFHYTMDENTIKYILSAINHIANNGKKYLHYYDYDTNNNIWHVKNWKNKYPEYTAIDK